jgi:microcystin degradation protein MlrC
MRIAIAGIHNEASTFSMHRADADFFELTRGQELVDHYRFPERIGAETVADVDWVPVLRATSGASGPIIPEAYDAFVEEIVDGLRAALAAGPLDGVYLDNHGAVAVDGRDDAEETFLEAIREVVGPDVVISASMDTHGNLSERHAALLDLVAVHRHAPHIDLLETRDRAVRNLIDVIRRGTKPAKVHVRVPILLPGERTSTAVEPGTSVFGALIPAIERYGVIDAGLTVGFFWADEPRCSSGLVVTAWDEAAAIACATDIAERYWAARDGFVIVAPHSGSFGEGLDAAVAGAARPVFISDAGDNVTAGASGDITAALAETFERTDLDGLRILFGGLTDAPATAAALAALDADGPGATLELAVGAGLDDRFAPPVRKVWTVERAVQDAASADAASAGGADAPRVGALLRSVSGGVDVSVVVQAERTPFVAPGDPGFPPGVLKDLAYIDPTGYDVVVVKNGYLFPSQAALAGTVFMAITPGGTDLDHDRLAFSRVERPVYPLDTDFTPDLTPVVL